MCNSKYQEDNGLSDATSFPARRATSLEAKMLAFASERRLANANGPSGGASSSASSPTDRWLQVNELQDARRRHGVRRFRHHADQAAPRKLVDSERRLMATIHDLQPGAPFRAGALDASWSS